MLRYLPFFLPLMVWGQSSTPLVSPQYADTWAATDALGRTLPDHTVVGDLDREKYVGIFYFIWLGAHGHDAHAGPTPTEGVYPKEAGVRYRSPYDISRILAANPEAPEYGPDLAFHHWGEPYFGYYLSDDDWVIARHAQLLSDAGVDVIVFDVTNAVTYLPIALNVCRVFERLQGLGWAVPKVAFLTNSRHVETTERLYEGFYKAGRYQDLWFRWRGKPLLMGNPEGLSDEVLSFFNFRRSWAWTEGQEWFGDGRDKWPWIDHYPQNYGWHDDPGTPEQIVVSSAQHPISNIGRSFHAGHQPAPDSINPAVGWFFAEQWRRALEVDPAFIFITGWNEWVAMRFTDGRAKQIMGQPIAKGETFFVDQYNAEFSRDIEPMKGGFGDNYYYQMVDGIRRFKGVRKTPASTGETMYYDHRGDIDARNAPGWGRIDAYTNTSGRYDLLEARVVPDGDALTFSVTADRPFEGGRFPRHLELLLAIPGATFNTNLGYSHRVLSGEDAGAGRLEEARGGWDWAPAKDALPVHVDGTTLTVTVPKTVLGLTSDYFEFKWIDNVRPDGDALRFMDRGDSAPNARFNYRYRLPKK